MPHNRKRKTRKKHDTSQKAKTGIENLAEYFFKSYLTLKKVLYFII